MRNKLVVVPTPLDPIKASPGFAKKGLSTYKLDLAGLCGFGCSYCSSNSGNYARIRRDEFANLTEQQTGERTYPATDGSLMFIWEEVIQNLELQLSRRGPTWGAGQTIVFSMLTDGFSPVLVERGWTERALRLLVARTSFRIRILTKNAIVGEPEWITFFSAHKDRFVVGLSTGTTDDAWAARVEVSTSMPSKRLHALHRIQAAGIPSYAMLCPVFPAMLEGPRLEQLVEAINPGLVEDVWAEPYNDRNNWLALCAGYDALSSEAVWLRTVFGECNWSLWSAYARETYERLRDRALRDRWIDKLHFLLYEGRIVAHDAAAFANGAGLMLQGPPGEDGRTKNLSLRAAQDDAGADERLVR